LRLAATWIPGASSPPVVHGANTSVTVEEEGLAGVVVGVVVVVGAVVVVLTATPGGCVVVVVGADAPDGDGSVVAIVVDVVAPDTCDLVEIVVGVVAAVLECVPVAFLLLVRGFGEPIDVDVGAAVDDGAVDMPEGSVPSVFGVVVVPLVIEGLEVVRAGLGTPGSAPGSKAKSNKIPTMAKPDAIPSPFCRRRNFAFFFISYPPFKHFVTSPYASCYPFTRSTTQFRGPLGHPQTLAGTVNSRV
jgi:hypothetical protein